MIRMLLGFAYLVLILWCIIDLLGSNRTSEQKLIWVIVIILFPLGGPVIYYLLSRKVIKF